MGSQKSRGLRTGIDVLAARNVLVNGDVQAVKPNVNVYHRAIGKSSFTSVTSFFIKCFCHRITDPSLHTAVPIPVLVNGLPAVVTAVLSHATLVPVHHVP